jgi:hypothetical protein
MKRGAACSGLSEDERYGFGAGADWKVTGAAALGPGTGGDFGRERAGI